jgi:hypothetical protein
MTFQTPSIQQAAAAATYHQGQEQQVKRDEQRLQRARERQLQAAAQEMTQSVTKTNKTESTKNFIA